MKRICLFLFAWHVCMGSAPLFAGEYRILTVEEPPSSFSDDRGEPAGFSVDIVREIQRRIHNHDPIQILPEIRAFKTALEYPNTVLFSFSRTAERENKFHWIMLLLRKPWVLYARKGTQLDVQSLDDAKKVDTIGVVRGDVRENYLRQMGFSNLIEVSRHEQGVEMLLSNRVELLFYEPLGMSILSGKLGVPRSEFKEVLKIHPSEVYLMMSKKTPWETVKKWQDAGRRIKEDGTFQRIAEKWEAIISEQYHITCEVKDQALNF